MLSRIKNLVTIPTPPSKGEYVLESKDGEMRWIEVVDERPESELETEDAE